MKMIDPPWLVAARKDHGLREYAGHKHNPAIVHYWSLIRAPFTDDETPWCAAYVGAKLEQVGIRSTRSAAARSYEKWKGGVRLKKPVYGCIVVFSRPPNNWSGHVGFVVGRTADGRLLVLGGNQGNAVSIKPFELERVVGYFWPAGIAIPLQPLPVMSISEASSRNEA